MSDLLELEDALEKVHDKLDRVYDSLMNLIEEIEKDDKSISSKGRFWVSAAWYRLGFTW